MYKYKPEKLSKIGMATATATMMATSLPESVVIINPASSSTTIRGVEQAVVPAQQASLVELGKN